MNFYKYNEKLTLLNQKYSDLSIILKLYSDKMYADLQNNKKNLQTESFQLVVVGEFSRGKSTFVNALLGRKMLPASLKPTTAVLSKIVYGEIPSYTLYYRKPNVSPKSITEEEFLKLVAPKEVDKSDQGLLKKFFSQQQELDDIEHAEIAYPLDLCKDNVELVDTPGTNDLSTARLDITYNYVNKADAVIMVLSANQALTASEMAFLKERVLGNQIQDIFFVISYKDTLKTPAEEEMVKKFVQENLLQVEGMPQKLRIHLVSSMQALLYRRNSNGEVLKPKESLKMPANMDNTGFIELENELGYFLSEEKGLTKLKKYVVRGQDIARQMYTDLAVQLELATHSADDLNAKIAKMKPEFEKAKSDIERYTQHMRVNLQNGVSELENACSIAGNDICKEANKAIDNFHISDDGNVDTNAIKSAVEKAVHWEIKYLIDRLGSIQNNLVDDEISKINRKIKKIWKDLDLDMGVGNIQSNIMDIQENKLDLQISISSSGSGNISDSVSNGMFFGGAFALIAGSALLPAVIVGGVVGFLFGLFDSDNSDPKAKIRKQINEYYNSEVSKISSKVTSDFRNQIDDICANVQSAVNTRLVTMERQLHQALEQKKKQEKDAQAEAAKLREHQKKLEQIYKDLGSIVQ